MKPPAEAFEWKHLNAIQDYDNAEKYLREFLQKRFDPKKLPIAKWRKELFAKTAEKDALYREYNSLKAESQKVEQIRRSVADIMREESEERTPKNQWEWNYNDKYRKSCRRGFTYPRRHISYSIEKPSRTTSK